MPKYRSSKQCSRVFPPRYFFQLLFGASQLRPHASLLPSAPLLILALSFVVALVCFSSAAYGKSSTATLSGTNNLVLIDALQEFKSQTSTYAPEFGCMPGGRFSIVTRSGSYDFQNSGATEFEDDVAKIERVLIRIFALGMLCLALLAVLVYASFELFKFVTHLPNSKRGG